MKKRLLGVILALCMILSLLPTFAFAAGNINVANWGDLKAALIAAGSGDTVTVTADIENAGAGETLTVLSGAKLIVNPRCALTIGEDDTLVLATGLSQIQTKSDEEGYSGEFLFDSGGKLLIGAGDAPYIGNTDNSTIRVTEGGLSLYSNPEEDKVGGFVYWMGDGTEVTIQKGTDGDNFVIGTNDEFVVSCDSVDDRAVLTIPEGITLLNSNEAFLNGIISVKSFDQLATTTSEGLIYYVVGDKVSLVVDGQEYIGFDEDETPIYIADGFLFFYTNADGGRGFKIGSGVQDPYGLHFVELHSGFTLGEKDTLLVKSNGYLNIGNSHEEVVSSEVTFNGAFEIEEPCDWVDNGGEVAVLRTCAFYLSESASVDNNGLITNNGGIYSDIPLTYVGTTETPNGRVINKKTLMQPYGDYEAAFDTMGGTQTSYGEFDDDTHMLTLPGASYPSKAFTGWIKGESRPPLLPGAEVDLSAGDNYFHAQWMDIYDDPITGPVPVGTGIRPEYFIIKGKNGEARVPATTAGGSAQLNFTESLLAQVGSNPNVDASNVTNEQLLVAIDGAAVEKIGSLGLSTADGKKKTKMLAELVFGYDHRISDVTLGVSLFPEKDSVTVKNYWYAALMPRVGYLITPQFELHATAAVWGAQFKIAFSDFQDTNPAAPGDTVVSKLTNPVGFAAYVKNGSGGASAAKFYVLLTEKVEEGVQARANIFTELSGSNNRYVQDAVSDITYNTEEGIKRPYEVSPDYTSSTLSNSGEFSLMQAEDLDKFVFFLADLPFTDVTDSDWFFKDVSYDWLLGIMEGIGADKFDPAGVTSRAMLTTMLWRLEGEPVVNYAMSFEDVPEDQWYTEAVRWAASEKIAEGYDAMFFGPNHPVTREQMATILWRYAKYKGYDVSVGEDTNILSYDDAFDIGEYAIPAIQWAGGAGLMQGSEGKIMPLARASRAEIAAVFHRFMMGIDS